MAFARVAHKGKERARCAIVWWDLDGRQKEKLVGCECRSHAKPCKLATQEAKNQTRNMKDARAEREDVLRADVAVVIDEWLKSKGMLSARGYRRYESMARHWKRWFVQRLGVPRFCMLIKSHVETYRDGRFAELKAKGRDGHCEKTVYCELSTLSQLCDWATRHPNPPSQRYASTNITQDVEFPPLPPSQPREFNAVQKAAILDAASGNPKLYLMFSLGFYAGLRREGVARLKVTDVHLDDERPYLMVEEKGRATRLGSGERTRRGVPIIPELAAAFKRCPPVEGSDYWFGDMSSQEYENLSPLLCAHIRMATGLKGLDARFHNCRHTFISELDRRTNNLSVTMKLAGHRSVKTTLRYRSVTTDDMHQAMQKLSAAG